MAAAGATNLALALSDRVDADHRASRLGSAMQLAGGLALAANPGPRGLALGISGTLINLIDRHVRPDGDRTMLKSLTTGVTAGLMVGFSGVRSLELAAVAGCMTAAASALFA